jgi:hypothetical protein
MASFIRPSTSKLSPGGTLSVTSRSVDIVVREAAATVSSLHVPRGCFDRLDPRLADAEDGCDVSQATTTSVSGPRHRVATPAGRQQSRADLRVVVAIT